MDEKKFFEDFYKLLEINGIEIESYIKIKSDKKPKPVNKLARGFFEDLHRKGYVTIMDGVCLSLIKDIKYKFFIEGGEYTYTYNFINGDRIMHDGNEYVFNSEGNLVNKE